MLRTKNAPLSVLTKNIFINEFIILIYTFLCFHNTEIGASCFQPNLMKSMFGGAVLGKQIGAINSSG